MQFSYTEVHAGYRVSTPFRLPHHSGSLLRGALGRALRAASCATPSACPKDCTAPADCDYARLFDPPIPTPVPHHLLRSATKAPQPLLPLLPPPGAQELHPGDPFRLDLRVLGPLSEPTAEHLRRALERLSEIELGRDRGRLRLEQLTLTPSRLPSLPSFEHPPHRATLTFQTPTRIEHERALIFEPDFPTLFAHISRRLTIVSALYGEHSSADDQRYKQLSTTRCAEVQARPDLHEVTWKRWSVERDDRYSQKGLLGTIELEGEIAPFVEYLQLIQYAHLGKATSFGQGRVRVSFM